LKLLSRPAAVNLQPILDAICLYHDLGLRVEITTLVIPGLNDSDEEFTAIARFIGTVGSEIPWHISRFYPAYQMLDRSPSGKATVQRARAIGLAEGLRYVYEGNIPGERNEKHLLLTRSCIAY
jgi:pyruvate formate lyase activating enzyme